MQAGKEFMGFRGVHRRFNDAGDQSEPGGRIVLIEILLGEVGEPPFDARWTSIVSYSRKQDSVSRR